MSLAMQGDILQKTGVRKQQTNNVFSHASGQYTNEKS